MRVNFCQLPSGQFACGASGVDPHDPASRAVENTLTRDIGTLRVGLGRYPTAEQDMHAVLELALTAADRAGLKQAHLQYRPGLQLDRRRLGTRIGCNLSHALQVIQMILSDWL